MKIYKLIASGLGTGYAPVAPGTAGSILGVVIFYFLSFGFDRYGLQAPFILVLNLVVISAMLFIGVLAIKKVHKEWIHDAPEIVIDEVIGVWITLLAIPFEWQYYLAGLVIFRFFDIAKPLYIRKLDNLKSDWSVMMDDVLAGVYSFIVLQLFVHFVVF